VKLCEEYDRVRAISKSLGLRIKIFKSKKALLRLKKEKEIDVLDCDVRIQMVLIKEVY
jgi:hypothetical protein